MFKYSTIFTAIIFLCAFLGCTISEDNLPNAEEALQKVSDIIDLNNLNVSGNPALDNVNASVIKHALEESQSVFKQKCDKNGGEGTFENAINAMNDLEQCLKSFVNFTKLEKEMERHKPTGDLDTVFKTYCRKTPTLKKCVSNFTTAIEPCLEPQERENKKIIQNITDSLLTFVCYKEGDRIALFISANGPECLQSKQQEIQQCVNITLGSYIPQTDFNNGPGLNSLPLLVFGTKECTDISKVQSCIVRELEKCKDPVPANIVDSIFNYIIKVTPCQKVINLQNTASNSTINLLCMSLIFLLLILT
ncbi:27 kDa hemolymph protein-like [Apis laboriosa]|uniref:27 kDa hemolymph protein-like n=1 Tax=Apis laboriosa TaxID=183418 RepID=UPI001CC427D7|nr:27 kDa hemolymph protein-like [Apis laboriosa]